MWLISLWLGESPTLRQLIQVCSFSAFATPKTRENPHKIRLLGEAAFCRENFVALRFGASLELLRSRRVCADRGAKILDLEDRDNVAAAVVPRRSQDPTRRGNAVAVVFFGAGSTSFLLEILAKAGCRTWFLDGELAQICGFNVVLRDRFSGS
jgi:hypothetical protein